MLSGNQNTKINLKHYITSYFSSQGLFRFSDDFTGLRPQAHRPRDWSSIHRCWKKWVSQLLGERLWKFLGWSKEGAVTKPSFWLLWSLEVFSAAFYTSSQPVSASDSQNTHLPWWLVFARALLTSFQACETWGLDVLHTRMGQFWGSVSPPQWLWHAEEVQSQTVNLLIDGKFPLRPVRCHPCHSYSTLSFNLWPLWPLLPTLCSCPGLTRCRPFGSRSRRVIRPV